VHSARPTGWNLTVYELGLADFGSRCFCLDRLGRAGGKHRRGGHFPRGVVGNNRQEAQSSLGAGGRGRGLGHAVPWFRIVEGRADLGLCRHPGSAYSSGGATTIDVLLNVYSIILLVLMKSTIVPFNLFWKVSLVIVLLLLLVGLFIPMGWGAPRGSAVVVRNSVQIVPDVAGQVIDGPVEPNAPIKAGDILFRIDPVPFEAQARTLETNSTRLAGAAPVADDANAKHRHWTIVRCRAAPGRGRAVACTARRREMEPRQDCGVRPPLTAT
jgi:hypothetical protein